MRYFDDDEFFDPVEANARTRKADNVLQAMRLGLIDAESITQPERYAIQNFYRHRPIYNDRHEVVGETDMVEGRHWVFATSPAGKLGIYYPEVTLSRAALVGATLHLWPDDFMYNPEPDEGPLGRLDFDDLVSYQDQALEFALAASA